MPDPVTLNKIEGIIEEILSKDFDLENGDPEEISQRFLDIFEASRESLKNSNIETYLEISRSFLPNNRAEDRAFSDRTLDRWLPAFDRLEMMWHIAEELGSTHGIDVLENIPEKNNATMAALANIFPKCLLIVQEIICLLKGGFPDGALSRWRSLHELSITAMYIAKHGEVAAVPYLLSFHFSSRRAAHQINEHSAKSGMKSFSKAEIDDFDARCVEAQKILGRPIEKDKDGEWPKINKSHTDFAAIEKDVGMDHWRPWYKWASSYTHADHRPADKLLGISEAAEALHLVGPSNSGFVDPFQLTALSLTQVLTTYLMHAPNWDRFIHIETFKQLSDELPHIALEAEAKSREAHKKS